MKRVIVLKIWMYNCFSFSQSAAVYVWVWWDRVFQCQTRWIRIESCVLLRKTVNHYCTMIQCDACMFVTALSVSSSQLLHLLSLSNLSVPSTFKTLLFSLSNPFTKKNGTEPPRDFSTLKRIRHKIARPRAFFLSTSLQLLLLEGPWNIYLYTTFYWN